MLGIHQSLKKVFGHRLIVFWFSEQTGVRDVSVGGMLGGMEVLNRRNL